MKSLYALLIVVSAVLSGCDNSPSRTYTGTADIAVYHPVPGVMCFSKSAHTLSCLYEVVPLEEQVK